MRWIRCWCGLVAALIALGCGEEVGPEVRVEVITPAGEDPTEGIDAIEVSIRENDLPVRSMSGSVDNGTFNLPLAVGEGRLAVSIRLTGEGRVRIGAAPRFFAREAVDVEGRLILRVPVGEPRSCSRVRWRSGPGDREPERSTGLTTAAADLGLTLHGSFAILTGGTGNTGSLGSVTFLDLLQLSRGSYDSDVVVEAGPVTAAALSDGLALGLGAETFLLDVQGGSVTPLPLSDAVGFDSGVASIPDGGAVVAGGSTEPSDVLLVIDASGTVEQRQMTVARMSPAVVVAGDRYYVTGGAPAASIEWGALGSREASGAVSLSDAVARSEPWVFASADGTQVLLGGGSDGEGVLLDRTVWLTGCPACQAGEGPRWAQARDGVASLPSRSGGGWLVGGAEGSQVERVRFGAGAPTIETAGTLAVARRDASLFELDAGVLYVAGGRTSEGFTDEVEVCFPEEIRL